MKTLVAGYGVGEFGWILMRWIPFVRHVAASYDNVICGIEPGHEYLYSDFCSSFVDFKEPIITRNMWMVNQREHPMRVQNGQTLIWPDNNLLKQKHLHYTYRHYGTVKYDSKYQDAIVIHARATNNLNTQYRNWAPENWIRLVKELNTQVICIGTLSGSCHIPRTVDCRAIELIYLCNLLSCAKCFVGPSSGPAHLASLCGCRHIVWGGDRKEVIGCSNKKRYLEEWNPFGTECEYINTWNPTVEQVLDCIR